MSESNNCCDIIKSFQRNNIWIHDFKGFKKDTFHELKYDKNMVINLNNIPGKDFFTKEYYAEGSIDSLYVWNKPSDSIWFSCGTWFTDRYYESGSNESHGGHESFSDDDKFIAIHIDDNTKLKLVTIASCQDAVEFIKKYELIKRDTFDCLVEIDWNKVKNDGYSGLIITVAKPYLWDDFETNMLFDRNISWLNSYDTESMVIWDIDFLKGKTKGIKLNFNN